jgi:hypothetical protein
MKKIALVILIGSGLSAASVSTQARDYPDTNHQNNQRSDPPAYGWTPFGPKLGSEINHLNRMVGHVRWQLGRYRANSKVRFVFNEIRKDVDRVNFQYKSGRYDRRQLHHEVERMHARLHALEQRLRVRSVDYYRWR